MNVMECLWDIILKANPTYLVFFFSIENISLNAFSKIKIYKGGKYTNIRDLNIEKHTDE